MAQLSFGKLKVGVCLPQEHVTFQTYAEIVQQVDMLGCDSIWNWDHFSPLTQGNGEAKGNHFESWTLLSAMAVLTKRAQIGCLVTCNNYRNPSLLSNMSKAIDHISNGRFILGIGAGWLKEEYEEYGYKFESSAKRIADLEKALVNLQKRWKTDKPRPVRSPIPILIGSEGEKVILRLVAQYAAMWHGFGDPHYDPDTYAHKVKVLKEWCKKIGRDPETIECVATTRAKNFTSDVLDAYIDAGATHIILSKSFPWDIEEIRWLIKWRDSKNQ